MRAIVSASGEACQLVCAFIRHAGKLPGYARRIQDSVTPQPSKPAMPAWRQSRPR